MSSRVETTLRAALDALERSLAAKGFLITARHLVDEGTWGRLDATLEGTDCGGKLQVHLNKKGAISIVPQGPAATTIAAALGQADPTRRVAIAPSRSAGGPPVSRAQGRLGEFVVDCSKFGQHLIGPTEWRGMLCTGPTEWTEAFHSPRYERGHNNLGEFLAIVDACRLVEAGKVRCSTIWSDSRTAISWFTNGLIKSTIDVESACDPAFARTVREAVAWLEGPTRDRFTGMLSQWVVAARGENPADFGRK